MGNKNIPFKVLTIAEMGLIKGAGPDQDYIGPPIWEGGKGKGSTQSFFSSWAAFFLFDFGAFFGPDE